MNIPTEKFVSPQQEAIWIAEQAQKAYALQNQEHQSLEQATAHTVEQYAQGAAKDFLHETVVLPEHQAEALVLKLKPETHDRKVEELFGIMIDKGIKNALHVVSQLNDSHLTDDFHRFLVQYLHTVGAIPGLHERSSLALELGHTLFTVTLPEKTTLQETSFKQFISAMKQFYLGMMTVSGKENNNHYTLEIAVQGTGSNAITIYASIPREHEETFEKLIHAYYPGAAVEIATDDYNIFSDTATAIAGTIAQLREPAIFPLAPDTSFEHDPLTAIIGALSKLATDGEGAAVQIVITNDTSGTNRLLSSIIETAAKGAKVADLYKDATGSLVAGIGKELLHFFKSPKEQNNETIDTAGIERAKQKNASPSISAGVRVIATGATVSRAQTILQSIKASFQQFTLVESNSIVWRDMKPQELYAFTRSFSFRTITPEDQLILSIDELATLFHFPVGLSAAPELTESKSATAPAPATMTRNGIRLGTNSYRSTTTDIYLTSEDRVRHTYVIGQTGTGKTTILKNMIIQDIALGNGCCFIDPHGTDLQDILANIPSHRLDDVIYFDPGYTDRPMGLNMLEYDITRPEQKIFVINELLAIFNKLFDMKVAGGPMFEQYFRNSAMLVMDDPESGSTLLEIGRVLTDKAFRDMKLSTCRNPIVVQFWQNAEKTTGESALANFVPYITNKFDVFISNDIMRPVIAQQKSVLNFRDIMDNKKILLVNLSKGRLGDINSHLIGLVLVGKLTMAALSRVDIVGRTEVNDFHLYIDEFQNVTTDSIATILSEARKYRLSLTVAHQYIEQLDEKIKSAVFGNVGNMIIYRVSPENATQFEQQLAPTFTPADILKLENFNAYAKILVNGIPQKPFNLRIPPPPQGNLEIADKIKQLSYLTYGRPRAEVEAEIMARYK